MCDICFCKLFRYKLPITFLNSIDFIYSISGNFKGNNTLSRLKALWLPIIDSIELSSFVICNQTTSPMTRNSLFLFSFSITVGKCSKFQFDIYVEKAYHEPRDNDSEPLLVF